jgi:hypothetical protein
MRISERLALTALTVTWCEWTLDAKRAEAVAKNLQKKVAEL